MSVVKASILFPLPADSSPLIFQAAAHNVANVQLPPSHSASILILSFVGITFPVSHLCAACVDIPISPEYLKLNCLAKSVAPLIALTL